MTMNKRNTVFPLPLWFVLIVTLLFGCWPNRLNAEPLYRASDGSVSVTLHSEACKLDAVKNLPKRATWSEKGKTYEGCYQIAGQFVVMYFEDRTVGLAPSEAFARVV